MRSTNFTVRISLFIALLYVGYHMNAQCPTGDYTGDITISSNCTISSNLTVTGNFTISNSSTLTIGPGVVLTITGDLQSSYQGGTITVNGGGAIEVEGRFYNQVFTNTSFTFSNVTVNVNNSGPSTVLNEFTSTLNLINGTVFTVVQGNFENKNQAYLTIDNSTLNVTAGNFLNNFQANLQVVNGGQINVDNGNFQTEDQSYFLIDNSNVYVNGDMNNDFQADLVIQNEGTLVVTGDFNNGQQPDGSGAGFGSVTVSNGSFSIGGDLNNTYGSNITIDNDGSIAVENNVSNEQAATIDVQDGTFSYGGSATDPFGGVSASTGDTECSDGCCGSECGLLPVQLIDFKAYNKSGYACLSWKTAGEINNDYFTIEESKDGKAFFPIGQVKGHGNTKNINGYTWNNSSYLSNLTFYRLSQTDFDGTTKIIGLLSIKPTSGNKNTLFYPNPVMRGGQIRVTNMAPEQVLIYQQTGQLLFEFRPGSTVFPLPDLEAGLYLIKFMTNGNMASDRLLVK